MRRSKLVAGLLALAMTIGFVPLGSSLPQDEPLAPGTEPVSAAATADDALGNGSPRPLVSALAEETAASNGDPWSAIGEAVDHRRSAARAASGPAVDAALDQQQRNLATAASIAATTGERSSRIATGLAIAELAAEHHAQGLAVALDRGDALPLAGYEQPSEALAALAERQGAELSREDHQQLSALDDAGHAQQLAQVVDAFLALDRATQAAFDAIDVSAFARQTHLPDPTAVERAPPTELAAAAGPGEMPERHRAELVDRSVGDPLAESWAGDEGFDPTPILASRGVFLKALADLQASLDGDDGAGECEPVQSAPAFSIALGDCPNTYTRDFALLLDGGGEDTFRNNAGGSNLGGPGNCPAASLLSDTGAAALASLGGADDTYGDPEESFPRGCGVNGGGYLGSGLLVDAGGNDAYFAGGGGTNGAAHQGVGFLLDLAGNDTYTGTVAANGAGSNGLGTLLDLAGDDGYDAGSTASNGGAASGSGFLVDAGGRDTFDADDNRLSVVGGTNGGGYGGNGFLLSLGGDDAYDGERLGVNGGSMASGTGFLADAAGDDTYTAQHLGTNGGGGPAGAAALLVDLVGDDTYEAGNRGTNGGSAQSGVAFLFDLAGRDEYTARFWGTNGGGTTLGTGTLVDGGGDDTYEALSSGVNGGASKGGRGLLADRVGDDTYEGVSAGVNGGALSEGVAHLYDGEGDDAYHAERKGTNGGAWSAVGGLTDGAGEDRYDDWAADCTDCTLPAKAAGRQIDSDDPGAERAYRDSCEDGTPHAPIRIDGDEGPLGFTLGSTPATGAVPRPGSGVVAGNGTAENPYLIAGWCLTSPPDNDAADQAAIEIADTSAHVRIQDVQVSRQATLETGILVSGASNVTIADSELDWLHTAIRLQEAQDVQVTGNEISTSFAVAIEAHEVEEGRIEGNELRRNTVGIHAVSSPWIEVRNNEIVHNGRHGVRVEKAPVRVVNNTIAHTGDLELSHAPSLYVEQVDAGLLEANELRENNDAIKLAESTNVAIENNTGQANDQDLVLWKTRDLEIRGNAWTTGMRFIRPEPAHLENEVADNTVDGQPLHYVTEDQVTIGEPAGQVIVANATDVQIEGLEATDVALGAQVLYSQAVDITGATIDGGIDAFRVYASEDVAIEQASIADTRRHALRAAHGQAVRLAESSITDAGGMIVYDWSVDGLVEGNEIIGNEHKVLFADDATNLTIRGNLVRNGTGNGVKSWSANTTVANNTFSGLQRAVIVSGSDGTVTGNLIENSSIGVSLSGADGRIVANTVRDNEREAITGVSENGTVQGNDVFRNGAGISFRLWPGIEIANNTVVDNDEFGIKLRGAHDGTVENNTIEASGIGVLLQEGFISETAGNHLRGNEIAENRIGVLVHGDAPGTTLRENNVHDSARDGLDASQADQEVDARWNWWGCSEGPEDAACDSVSGDVAYEPWLTTPNGEAGRG